jgi:ABC-type phosphate transport system ATPase subunit
MGTEGITLVWVTHDVSQAERVAYHEFELRGGRLSRAPGGKAGQW